MIGIDIITIKRFKKIQQGDYKIWDHVFSQEEWAYSFRDARHAHHLAGIFAAKEAAMKSVGAPYISHYELISISHDASGKPFIRLNQSKFQLEVSISHDEERAIAVVFGSC